MNKEDTIPKALREVGPRYIANSQQQLVGFLLTPEEYDDYLNMRLRSVLQGLTKAALHRKGRPVPENDVWIAALARQHQLTLVTRDAHFSHIPNLVVESWA